MQYTKERGARLEKSLTMEKAVMMNVTCCYLVTVAANDCRGAQYEVPRSDSRGVASRLGLLVC
jgi:hypothetical protein